MESWEVGELESWKVGKLGSWLLRQAKSPKQTMFAALFVSSSTQTRGVCVVIVLRYLDKGYLIEILG